MKKLLLIALLSLHAIAGEIFWNDSYVDAAEEAKEDNKPMLVFMSQAGCSGCQYMEDNVLSDPKVRDYIDAHYVAVHLDIHDNDAPKNLQMPVTPVFHFLKSDGSELKETLVGGKTTPFFYKIIKL